MLITKCKKQLEAYFNGTEIPGDLPIDFVGTPFQILVWKRICQIPNGKTMTYAQLARAIGDTKKTRAVARACGQNKHMILIPCHRVIGSDGNLTGYAYGLDRKEKLLSIEGTGFTQVEQLSLF